jgi:hypothetical protein
MKSKRRLFISLIIILFFSSTHQAQIELESHWGGGKCQAIALAEANAYFAFGSYLYSYNLHNYQLAGSFEVADVISDIVVDENTLYIGTNHAGIYVFDCTDPSNILQTAHLDCYARRLFLQDARLYVASLLNGFTVYDISDALQPILLSQLDTEARIYDVVENGNFLYGAGANKGLVVVDQSDPTSLKELDLVESSRSIFSLMKHKDYVYASSDANAGIDIFGVSNPAEPILRNSIVDDDPVGEMKMLGDVMFVGSYHIGIRQFDLSDPESPIEISRHDVGTVNRFALNDHILCTVDDHDGAYIYPIADNEIVNNLGHYDLGFQAFKVYGINKSILYIPELISQYDEQLRIIDLSDPLRPVEQGYLDMSTEDLVVKGDFAYLIKAYKLYVVDISNPIQPVKLNSINLSAEQKSLAIYGDLLFAYSDGLYDDRGLNFVDISNPDEPVEFKYLGHQNVIEQLGATASALFVVDHEKQLYRIDMRTPENPVFEPQPWYADSIAGCWVRNDVGYFTDVEDSLRIYDLSDPFQPILVHTMHSGQFLRQPLFYGERAYISGFQGMEVFDFSDPFYPVKEGGVSIPGYFTSPTIVDNWLVISKVIYEEKLSFFDLSFPTQPTLAGRLSPFGRNNGIVVKGDSVLLANDLGGLRILHMSDDSAVELAAVHPRGRIQALALQDEYVYLAVDGEGMIVVDLSDWAHPSIVGSYHPDNNGNVKDIVVHEDIACLIGGAYGVKVIDVSSKDDPVEIAALPVDWKAQSGFIADNLLYVCRSNSGIQVHDISDPVNPLLIGEFDTQGTALDICIHNDTAYLADGMYSFRLLDVSNPSDIIEIGAYDLTPAFVNSVDFAEGYALVTGSFMGLYMLDVRDPEDIELVTRFFVIGNDFNDVKIQQGNIFVSCENNGVYKLSSSLLTSPIDTTTAVFFEKDEFIIGEIYPNPFSDQTTIRYKLISPKHVLIEILDLKGQNIATLVDEQLNPGNYITMWYPRNIDSRNCPPGVYLCRINIGGRTVIKKVILGFE